MRAPWPTASSHRARVTRQGRSMSREISVPARLTRVDVVARLVGPSEGRHSPLASSASDTDDEPPNVAYLRATARCRCAACLCRTFPLTRSRMRRPDAAYIDPAYRWLSVSTACRLLLLSAAVIAAIAGLPVLLRSPNLPTVLVEQLPAYPAAVGWPPYQIGAPLPPPPWWARSPPPPPPPRPPTSLPQAPPPPLPPRALKSIAPAQ